MFSTVLRSYHEDSERNPAKLLRLLLKDRYFETLVDLFVRHKIEQRKVRLVFQECVDEFKHCMQASADQRE